jgi:hypothetical protein
LDYQNHSPKDLKLFVSGGTNGVVRNAFLLLLNYTASALEITSSFELSNVNYLAIELTPKTNIINSTTCLQSDDEDQRQPIKYVFKFKHFPFNGIKDPINSALSSSLSVVYNCNNQDIHLRIRWISVKTATHKLNCWNKIFVWQPKLIEKTLRCIPYIDEDLVFKPPPSSTLIYEVK